MNQNLEKLAIEKYKDGHGLSCIQIGKELNVAGITIARILKRNNISIRPYRRSVLPEELHKEVSNLYQNKQLNTHQLAKKYNVSRGCIINILKRNNIKIPPKCDRMRKYKLNENFFERIDTQEKAYFLGFLYADGYNNGFNCVTIGLHQKDRYILQKFCKLLEYEEKIYDYNKRQNISIIYLNSQKISNDLTNLGCYKNKSLTLKFPSLEQVSERLLPQFIRGYMDGDGCVRFDKKNQGNVSFVGSNSFIDSLQNLFIKDFNIKGYKRRKKVKNEFSELTIGGNNQSLKILDWLYKDSSIHLDRKYQKYLQIKNYKKNLC